MSFQYRAAHVGTGRETRAIAAALPKDGGIYRRWGKRAFDLALVAVISLPVALVVLILALCVSVDGRNPFYTQERVGRDGRIFRLWKLRTMVLDGDRVLSEHFVRNPEARTEWDRHQKLSADPRVTTVGRFLRASSLDELPQIWNVLVGDMSLVGPRPMMTSQRVLYPGTEYYAMLPGITGLWQVSERNECEFHQRAEYDQLYFGSMTLWTDLRVLARTVSVVLRATGR